MAKKLLVLTSEIREYFEDHNVIITDFFNLNEFAELEGMSQHKLAIALVNLEDEKIMQEIADGNYDNFDINNPNIFNDSYADMMNVDED